MGQQGSAAGESVDTVKHLVRSTLPGLVLIGAFINILLFVIAFYFALAQDVMLPARNVTTLVGLALLMTLFCLAYGGFELVRARLLGHLANGVDMAMAGPSHEGIQYIARNTGGSGDGLEPVRDLDVIRRFLTGSTPAAILDLPWALVATVLLFLLHPWMGAVGLIGVVALAGVLYLIERSSSGQADHLAYANGIRFAVAEDDRRNALLLRGLGMEARLRRRWLVTARDYLLVERQLDRATSALGGVARAVRLFLMILLLSVGLALAFADKASGGLIIGGSILFYLALAPLDRVVAGWGDFVQARQAWGRISLLLGTLTRGDVTTILPRPQHNLIVEPLFVAAPGSTTALIQNVGFQLDAGDTLGIVGPSGSGKTVLMNVLTGVWTPLRGAVRFDGAKVDQWDADDLGRNVGYLPQSADLMDGTIARNIARFDPESTSEQVIAAAQAAGVHEFILRLPGGYETEVGRNGGRLSGGARQRIALARALYGDPFLVLLDEPSSNLDGDGEQALVATIQSVRARGGIVVVVTQRPAILQAVEDIMVLQNGAMAAFGPRQQIMTRLIESRAAAATEGTPS